MAIEKELLDLKQREGKMKEESRQLPAVRFERDEARAQLEKIELEKTAIEKEVREIRSEVEIYRARLWAPPGHYHSPITDPHDPFVRQTSIQNLDALKSRPDFKLDDAAMLRLVQWLGEQGAQFPFPAEPNPKWRYYTGNGQMSHADAEIFFAMMLEYKPARFVEIGCGHSSLLAMDTNDHFLGGAADMTFFDPRPDVILSLLGPNDAYRERVHARRSHDVPEKVFEGLKRGDMLALNTSHVAKTGSDVCDVLFRVLPLLSPGVLVYIHEIFYPFEYPESWVVGENRSWNETYLLRAFLQYNNAFRIVLFNNYVLRSFRDAMNAAFPGLEDIGASGLWLERC